MGHIVYLAQGSNLGDRAANLKLAINLLPPSVKPLNCSPVYQTPPWGYSNQPAFLNQVIKAETDLKPEHLLTVLKQVEDEIGREPTFRFGPRVIDLDILFYNHLVYQSNDLIIPHPRISERAFVLVPLADLAPDFSHPVLLRTIREMLAFVDTNGIEWYSAGDCGKITDN